MGLFRKGKSKTKSISQSYKDSKGFSNKWKFWENHTHDSFYDPTYDFRIETPVKKKRRWWQRKKKVKTDKYDEGRDRVKNIINK